MAGFSVHGSVKAYISVMVVIMVVVIREFVRTSGLRRLTLFRFLWRVDPHDNHEIQVYKWTGRNDYVALCEKGGFSFGGGYVILCFAVTIMVTISAVRVTTACMWMRAWYKERLILALPSIMTA